MTTDLFAAILVVLIAAGLAAKATLRARDQPRRTRGTPLGPSGRAHFADPRPGDFPGRVQPVPECEPEAG